MFERLKDLREDNDYYQKDIAKILKMSQVQYSRYETGVRLMPIDKLIKLADFYNVSLDYLVSRTDERNPYPKSMLK